MLLFTILPLIAASYPVALTTKCDEARELLNDVRGAYLPGTRVPGRPRDPRSRFNPRDVLEKANHGRGVGFLVYTPKWKITTGPMRRTTPLWYMPTPLPEYHRWAVTKYMGWTA